MSFFKSFLKIFGGLFAVASLTFAVHAALQMPTIANASAVCTSTGPQCGTDSGTQTSTVTDNPNLSCPGGYTLQNDGDEGQQCHRILNCSSYPPHQCPSEHVTPTQTCPQGDTQSGSGSHLVCTHTTLTSCHTGTIDYSACAPAGQCSTSCGQPASQVPDGKGGFKQCSATAACAALDCDGDTDGSTPNGDDECVTPTPVEDNDCLQPGQVDTDNSTDDIICVTPTPTVPVATPTPTVAVTPTPTSTPPNGGVSSGGGPGDGLNDGLGCGSHPCGESASSNGPVQAILGASTMAGTGSFENTLMDIMLVAGMIVLSLGGLSYAKEKK